tara:strand:+ start:863 stop:1138 length:276 start_codon:yes stop_codon:yes gene_type:complete
MELQAPNSNFGVKNSGMTDEDKLGRAIALRAIAEKTQELEAKGATPMEQQTFVQGARRELARQRPDARKHELASDAARRFKEYNSGGTSIF